MEAKLAQVGEVVVVTINGRLDIDMAPPFKEACLKNLLDKKVVFNLQPMSFVGSTGIQSFFQVLKELHAKNKFGVRIAGMTADFLRLWKVHTDATFVIYETSQTAVLSFDQPVIIEESVTAPVAEEASVVRIS